MPQKTYDQAVLHKNAAILVRFCAATKPGEKVLLVFDDTTREIEPYLTAAVEEAGGHLQVAYMPVAAMHGVEPPQNVLNAMELADVILVPAKFSLIHTQARLRASNRGARYLSLPEYSLDQLSQPSLGVDFHTWARKGKIIKGILDKGSRALITSKKGTHLELEIGGRVANWAPGFCDEPGMIGSPPDIETNVAPVETGSRGVIVVDGSIPFPSLGLLSRDIRVTVVDGAIVAIDGGTEGETLAALLDAVPDRKRRILAEFGIGLNPEARLCGLMLEDEGTLGTVHFGFGSNATFGGLNKTDFHLDMVIRNPTVDIDGVRMIDEGALTIPEA